MILLKIAKRNNDIKVYSECYDSDPIIRRRKNKFLYW